MGYVGDEQTLGEGLVGGDTGRLAAGCGGVGVINTKVDTILAVAGKGEAVGGGCVHVLYEPVGRVGLVEEGEFGEEVGGVEDLGECISRGRCCYRGLGQRGQEGSS